MLNSLPDLSRRAGRGLPEDEMLLRANRIPQRTTRMNRTEPIPDTAISGTAQSYVNVDIIK
jgi:hypothetical protein